jgi:pterin-4a-carbinolamine dehydratase
MSNQSNRSTAAQVQGLERPGENGLKAERIQSALVGETRLKAERIQLALRDLPGWRLQRGARQISRTFEVTDAREAARLLQYVADMGLNGQPMPDVSLQRGAVTFTLPTVGDGWLETEVLELAKTLEVKE